MKQLSIATLGTSLTFGRVAKGNWQNSVAVALRPTNATNVVVYNFGIDSASSVVGLQNLAMPLHVRPDIVLIEYSINDAYVDFSISTTQSRANVLSIISAFRDKDPNVAIFLMLMNPCVPGSPDDIKRPNRVAYADIYRDLASSQPGIGLIDNEAAWGIPTFALLPDGIHPPIAEVRSRLVPDIVTALNPIIA